MDINLSKETLVNRIIQYYVFFHDNCPQYKSNYETIKIFTEFLLSYYNSRDEQQEKKQLLNNLKTKNNPCKNINFKLLDGYHLDKLNIVENGLSFSYKIYYNETHYSFDLKISDAIERKLSNKRLISYLVFLYHLFGFETGQFWGIAPDCYKLLANKHENIVECFASPFNHNLNDYYSPLYFIDSYYGSSGSFFSKFLSASFTTYIINPPFIVNMMTKIFELALLKLKQKNVTIYFYLPYWNDIIDPFLLQLKNYYNKHYILEKNTSFVYDYIKEEKIINKSFPLVIIYVSNCDDVPETFDTFHKMLLK